MRVLTVNAGSSSLKVRVLEGDQLAGREDFALEDLDGRELAVWARSQGVDAIGHRVVHGGAEFIGPVLVDDRVVAALRALTGLAPLHQAPALELIDSMRAALPGTPAVACFDTAFHASMPESASTYAVPLEWRQRWHLRRYGFHGLSHAYASRRTAQILRRPLDGLRIVTCHLGAGASLAAVSGGVCKDTTMGFTPLEGLVMATRSGSVDPGMILWLQASAGLAAGEIADALENRSGLLALAGTADTKRVFELAGDGDPRAVLALGVYVHRLRCGIASMAAAMAGVDAIVFTGGVGENDPHIRRMAIEGLGFLGAQVDDRLNAAVVGDEVISPPAAPVQVCVVESREDLEIARQVRELLGASAE